MEPQSWSLNCAFCSSLGSLSDHTSQEYTYLWRVAAQKCSAAPNTKSSVDLQMESIYFLVVGIAFTGRGTYFETRYKWKESMKQLLHLCGTWQQQQWKRCIRLPFSVLFHWAASPAFLQPVKLPWQQSEQSSWGTVKSNVQWWSVRKLLKESIQWLPSLGDKMSITQASGQG